MSLRCTLCEKLLKTKGNHRRHLEEVHNVSPERKYLLKYSSRCLEPDCNNVFINNKNLIIHLENIHEMKFEIECHSVQDMKEFKNWKSIIENENNISYVFKRKTSSTKGEITYYKCNRSKTSRVIKETNQRSRMLKRQGSCKMDNSCTSEIKLVKDDNNITIEWQKTHYGHNIDLQHIRLPQIEKQKIVMKMINGVSSEKILESVRDNTGESLKRIDLLTSSDLRNLKKQYGLEVKDGKRDSNDAISVSLWVEECKNLKENPILFYEEQGEEHPIFEKQDFCNLQNPKSTNILENIKNMISKLEILDFSSLDDETISKIYHHLLIINNLSHCPKRQDNQQDDFEIKNKSTKRGIDTQIRFVSTKKKKIPSKTSLICPSQHEANIQKHILADSKGSKCYGNITDMSFLMDHQYC